MTPEDVEAFDRCVRDGGVAVFPADTVYGLACDPDSGEAVARLYALKGRRSDKPAAVMFFDRTLGLRVPALHDALAPLVAMPRPVLQSSANLAGAPDARRIEEVPDEIRAGADLVLDGGELPGTPSTVVDLRALEADGSWAVVREGAVEASAVAARLQG